MSKMIRNPLSLVVPAALALLASSSIQAATATANLGVTATVSDNCVISTSAVAFGSYDPITTHAASALDGSGTVTVNCTTGAATVVTLGQGANADTGSTDAAPLRRMNAGASFLSYSLFQDGARSVIWGNTVLTGSAYTGDGTADALTVYGRVAAGQNVPAGSYSDTVVATITF